MTEVWRRKLLCALLLCLLLSSILAPKRSLSAGLDPPLAAGASSPRAAASNADAPTRDFAVAPATVEPLSEHWSMELGSSRELELPPGGRLRLSQKRLVEIEELGPRRVRILAMRSGLVYLRVVSPEGRLLRSWLLEIAAKSAPRAVSAAGARLMEKPWRHYYCSEVGVNCDEENFEIGGTTQSLIWLQQARKQCEKQAPCRFNVQLEESARQRWQQQLQQELERPDLNLSAEGTVLVSSVCGEGKVQVDEQLARYAEQRYGAPLLQRCRGVSSATWVLDVIAVATREQNSERDNPLQWDKLTLPLDTPLRALIQGLSARGQAHIIAQPQVQLNEGSEVLVSDGLELQTVVVADDRTSSAWKSVGFELRAQLRQVDAGRARLACELRLSRPRDEGRALDASQLQTELWLQLELWHLVGRLQARTDGEDEAEIPWLSAVPGLGWLFRWKVEQQAASEVSLYARLRPADGRGVEPPSLDAARPLSPSLSGS